MKQRCLVSIFSFVNIPMTTFYPDNLSRLLIAVFFFVVIPAGNLSAQGEPENLAPLKDWMTTTAQTRTLQADLRQTREMKTFNRPLTSTGRFFYQAPSQYRWQIEEPQPKSAILAPEKVAILYPKMKRMELIELESVEKSSWRDTLELIRAGFPRSLEDLEEHFRIVGLQPAPDHEGEYLLQLHLRRKRSGNPVQEVQVLFDPQSPAPKLTALIFGDGSRVLSQFTNVQVNQPLPEDIFDTTPPEGYSVTNPLEK